MKYFLGYYDGYKYIPIKEEIGDTLAKVVEYTTSFPSIKKLKEELLRKRLIPNATVRIDYIIEKGTKDKRVYQKINSTDKIYTVVSKRFFDIASLKEQIEEDIGNPDFVSQLSSRYIKKYGYLKNITSYLLKIDSEDLKLILEKIKGISLSEASIKDIDRILEFLNDQSDCFSYDTLDGLIEDFIKSFTSNSYDITNMYIFFKRYIKFRNIPAMSYLSQWLQVVIDELHGTYRGSMELFDDSLSRESAFHNFFNEIVYDFDYVRKEYKMEKGSRKIKYRELFDLAVFVEEFYQSLYNEYINALSVRITHDDSEVLEEDGDDIEEFLNEEDFVRIGTTSEEAGYNLRRNGY